jgi:mRNA interferase MazF
MEIKLERGDIVVCALTGDYGKPRPAVITQSNLFNPTHASITLCPITTHLIEAPLFRLLISPSKHNGLKLPSQIMIDKVATLPREKISKKIGVLNPEQQVALNHALKTWLELR